jgi:LacI family transcriptional regulator
MERDFPFATHGRTEWSHPYIDYDNDAFSRLAVRLLAARGRRRVALLRPPPGQSYSIHLHEGARAAAAELGCRYEVVAGATSDSPAAQVEDAIRATLSRPDAPDGLLIPSAAAVMAAVAAAEDRGLVLGRDFDVAAKEAIPFLRRFRRDILTLREDVQLAGDFVARALIHRIAHPSDPPMQYLDVPGPDWDGRR